MKRWRQRKDDELNAEIRSHLDEAIRDRIERDEAPKQARAHALREFGNVGLVKEVTREMWGWAWLERLMQDLRFGLRMLRKNPGFSFVAILKLTLGIGANTAIFSVVNAVLLNPLPYADPDRLMMVWESGAKTGGEYAVRVQNFLAWQRQQQVFEHIGAFQYQDFNLTGNDKPERIQAVYVTANLFPLLGVQPALGRGFLTEEERHGRHRVVIISQDFQQRYFGATANPQGQALSLNGETYQVRRCSKSSPRQSRNALSSPCCWGLSRCSPCCSR